jgi:hypothetical protein
MTVMVVAILTTIAFGEHSFIRQGRRISATRTTSHGTLLGP